MVSRFASFCILLACVLQGQVRAGELAIEFRREQLVRHVDAAYPVAAEAARVSGGVILEAVVGKNGVVDTLRLVSGHPLLVNAAFEAAKQFRYLPATVNGTPVKATTFIWITFPTGSVFSAGAPSTRNGAATPNPQETPRRSDLRLFTGIWQGEMRWAGINAPRGLPVPMQWKIECEGGRLVRATTFGRNPRTVAVSYQLDGSETQSDGSDFPLQFAPQQNQYRHSRGIKTLSSDLIELEERLFAGPEARATGADGYAMVDESWELNSNADRLRVVQDFRTLYNGSLQRFSTIYEFRRTADNSGR